MKIALLGTGMVGQALAPRLAGLQHEVLWGTRDPDVTRARPEMGDLLAGQPLIQLLSFDEAAAGAPLVIHAGNGSAALDVLAEAGSDALAGKVLLDLSNPLDFSAGFPPTLSVSNTDSLGEQIQAAFPATYVVKSLNTLTADLMAFPDRLPEATTVFVSGNAPDAKQVVTGLLRELGHRDIVDLGDITTARGTEMYLALWTRTYAALGTGMFNVRIVRSAE